MNFYFYCTNFLINSYQSHIWLRFFKCVYKTFFLEFSTSSLISGKNLASLDVLWVKSCTAFSISFLQKAVIQYFLLLLLSCEKGSVHFLADRTVVTSVKICVFGASSYPGSVKWVLLSPFGGFVTQDIFKKSGSSLIAFWIFCLAKNFRGM